MLNPLSSQTVTQTKLTLRQCVLGMTLNCIHIFIVSGSFLYWCVMRPASQRFFIHSCIYLRILIISYLATFLGTNSLSVLMCRKAVNQSINPKASRDLITVGSLILVTGGFMHQTCIFWISWAISHLLGFRRRVKCAQSHHIIISPYSIICILLAISHLFFVSYLLKNVRLLHIIFICAR